MRNVLNRMLSLVNLKLVRLETEEATPAKSGIGGERITLPEYPGVETIIDVGVAGGTPWLYDRFKTQHLILVEPLNVVSTLQERLSGRSYEIHECAAAAAEGHLEMNFDVTQPSLSSLLERTKLTKRAGHRIERRVVPARTIDSIVAKTRFPTSRVGLKIDSEGFELEVLKGSTATLKKCAFVVCEASIERRFEHSYDFSDLVVFMQQRNFTVRKILDVGADRQGVVRMVDVLFEPSARGETPRV